MRRIDIAADYSDTPLGRYEADSEFNGTRFREEFLRPALDADDKVVVGLDDVEGYGSSFLEEAFGGLVRKGYFTADELRNKLQIEYRDEALKMFADLIWKYIRDAKREPAR